MSGENSDANDRWTLGVGGDSSPHRQLTASTAIYPHLPLAALTSPVQRSTLADTEVKSRGVVSFRCFLRVGDGQAVR